MTSRVARTVFALTVALPLAACGGRQPPGGAEARDRNVITQEQIRERFFANAFDAVQALRPNWLVTSGPGSSSAPSRVQVYLDDSRLGGIGQLRSIMSQNIVFIRYINGIDATTRWGVDHGAGVIYVSTRQNGAL